MRPPVGSGSNHYQVDRANGLEEQQVTARLHRECDQCGALLGDRRKHEDWHRAQLELLHEIRAVAEASGNRMDDQERRWRQATTGL